MSISILGQINQELSDLRDSTLDQADSYVAFLTNSKRKYEETVATILDTDTLQPRGTYFQCDLGIFDVRELQEAILSEDINRQVTLFVENNGITEEVLYDYGEVITSMGTSISTSQLYIDAIDSITQNGDDITAALNAFVAKTSVISSAAINSATNTCSFIVNVLSNGFNNGASAIQTLIHRATVATDGTVAWLHDQANSITGVSLSTTFSQVFWPTVAQALAGMGSVLLTAVTGVFGIVVSVINGLWTAVTSIANASSVEYPIIGKSEKGQYPGLYCYDADVFNLKSSEINNSKALIGLSFFIENVVQSDSYLPNVWFTIPMGCTNFSVMIISYTSRYVWEVNMCIKDVLPIGFNDQCWRTDLSATGVAWTNPLQFVKNLKQAGFDGNGTDDVIGDQLQYPSTAVSSALMMSRIITAWYSTLLIDSYEVQQGIFSSLHDKYHNAIDDPDSPGYGMPDDLSSGFMHANSLYFNIGGTQQAEYNRLTNLELFNAISGANIKAILCSSDMDVGYQWHTRYYRLLVSALSSYMQKVDQLPDEPWNRWWRASLPTPRYFIKTDLSLKAQYSATAIAAISAVAITAITIAACTATAVLKRKAFAARRKADLTAFDENASSKQAYKANKLANVYESLYASSSKLLNFGATTSLQIAEDGLQVASSVMGSAGKTISQVFGLTDEVNQNMLDSSDVDSVINANSNLNTMKDQINTLSGITYATKDDLSPLATSEDVLKVKRLIKD